MLHRPSLPWPARSGPLAPPWFRPSGGVWRGLVPLLALLLSLAHAQQGVSLNVPSTALVGAPVAAQMSFPGLTAPSVTLNLAWGDGSSSPVTFTPAAPVQTATHVYSTPGSYLASLSAPGVAPVNASLTVLPRCQASLAPNPAEPGGAVTANLSSLPTQVRTPPVLDWGDGTRSTLPPGQAAASVTKAGGYAQPGTYTVTVQTASGDVLCSAPLTVTSPAPTLTVTPASGNVGDTFTATLGNLRPGVSYTLDWGEGSPETVTGNGTATRTHLYRAPGTFAVRLSAPGLAPVVQPVTVGLPQAGPGLTVTPSFVTVGESVTASVTGPATGFQIQWGDGSVSPASANVTHTYTAPGTFVVRLVRGETPVPGVAPVVVNVLPAAATVPAPTLAVNPLNVLPGESVEATAGNLVAGTTYTLDWGDGTQEGVTGSGTARRTHAYAKPGVYVVRLFAGSNASPPVTVQVGAVTCPVLTTSETPVRLWASVEYTFRGLPTGRTLTVDWGDGSAPTTASAGDGSVRVSHTYASTGTFQIGLSLSQPGRAPQVLPCKLPVVVQAAQVPLLVTPPNPRVGEKVTLTAGEIPPGTAVRVDWGDGKGVESATATGTRGSVSLGTHTYTSEGTFVVKVSLPDGTSLGTVPVTVNVPLSSLTVTPERAGQPSLIELSGLVVDSPGYIYVLNFGDGATEAIPATSPTRQVKHVYAQSGVYTVTLRLTSLMYQIPARTVAQGVANIGAAVTVDTFSTEVRAAPAPAQPLPGTGTPAPTPVDVKQGVQAASVVTLNVDGSGPLGLRWTWTPLDAKDAASGTPVVLDNRTVTLKPGLNTAQVTLPTTTPGRYALKVEALPTDPKVPAGVNVTVQVVNVVSAAPPKLLVLGEGDHRFRFTIVDLILLDKDKVTGAPKQFDPNNFWARIQIEGGTLTVGSLGVPLPVTNVSRLKVVVDGDTATLKEGSFSMFAGSDKDGPFRAPLPDLFPMELKVRKVNFSPAGAVLDNAVVTSPDYEAAAFTLYLKKLIEKKIEKDPGMPQGPDDLLDIFSNELFDQVLNIQNGPGGSPVLTPIQGPGGRARGPILAQGRTRAGSEPLAYQGSVSVSSALANSGELVSTGSGYGTFKGANVLEEAAKAGVNTGYGVTIIGGAGLGSGGRLDVGAMVGPVNVEELDLVLGGKQVDFLKFPSLYLDNHGYLVSARMEGGVSQASFPTAANGGPGGTLKLGDSGLAMDVLGQPNSIYLDLNPNVSVQPQGFMVPISTQVQGPDGKPVTISTVSADQSTLLRETYSGAPAAVKVPDVGPGWQGLLWLSNNIQINQIKSLDVLKGKGQSVDAAPMNVSLKQKVPVSFGKGGWNMNVDADVASAKNPPFHDWVFDPSHIKVVVVRSNLLRSVQTASVGPLPFVGGGVLTGTLEGTEFTPDQAGLTRAYGPDGNFTATSIVFKSKEQGTFYLAGTFDLSRVSPGLKLSCSELKISATLHNLSQSACNKAAVVGERTFAGTKMTVVPGGVKFAKDSKTGDGQLRLEGKVNLGESGQAGQNITTPAFFALIATASQHALTLHTDKFAQDVKSTEGQALNLGFEAQDQDLTGVGAQAIGAGLASFANQDMRFDSGEMKIGDDFSMRVRGLFGRSGSQSRWYVLASGKAKDGVSFGGMKLYEVYGGMAYNLAWNPGTGSAMKFSDIQKEPTAGQGLTLAAGVVGDLGDDTVVHAAALVLLRPTDLKIDFGGDAYLLVEGGIKKGYFAGAKPQGRFRGSLGLDGLKLGLCVGPAGKTDLLDCTDLQPLGVAKGVVQIQGIAELEVSKTPHVYIGWYKPAGAAACEPYLDAACAALYRTQRVSATVDLKVYKPVVDGYVMLGWLDPQRTPPLVNGGPVTGTGLVAGAAVEYLYHAEGSESVLVCTAKWHFDARLYQSADAALTVVPARLAGQIALSASASVGGSLCGVGGSVSAALGVKGNFDLTPDSGKVWGEAHVKISLPVVPDVDEKFGFSTSIY